MPGETYICCNTHGFTSLNNFIKKDGEYGHTCDTDALCGEYYLQYFF